MSRWIYNLGGDNSSLSRSLRQQQDDFLRSIQEKEKWEAMEERIFNRVMERVNIQIVNDASPAIDKLKNEINKSLSNL